MKFCLLGFIEVQHICTNNHLKQKYYGLSNNSFNKRNREKEKD